MSGLTITTERRERLIRSTHIIKSSEHTNRWTRSWYGFEIVTSHSRADKAYTSRVRRLEQHEGGGTAYVYDLRNPGLKPLEDLIVPTGRYSLAALENVHGRMVSRAAGVETFAALVAWAEAQGAAA